MPKIFISYRREDTPYEAIPVRDRLAEHFGRDEIFFDIDAIPLGHDFSAEIERQVAACNYFIALIGKSWLTVTDQDGCRRLDNPNDWVRLEVEAALKRKIPLIPLLFHNVRMPKSEQLPAALAELAKRQAHSIRPLADFNRDLDRLIRELDQQEIRRLETKKQALGKSQLDETVRSKEGRVQRQTAPENQGVRLGPERRGAGWQQHTRVERNRTAPSDRPRAANEKSAKERGSAEIARSDAISRSSMDVNRKERVPAIQGRQGAGLPILKRVLGRQAPNRRTSLLIALAIAGFAVALAIVPAISFIEKFRAQSAAAQRARAYEDRLNEYLSPVTWAGNGVELRVPKEFQPITAQAIPGDHRDPRQPRYMDLEFPGLLGAWEATFPPSRGQREERGWLYLCGNNEFLAKREEAKATSFNSTLIHRIATAVGMPDPPPEKLAAYEVPRPGDEEFVEKRQFRVVKPGFPASVGDRDYRILAYIYFGDTSPDRLALVYVLPDEISLDRAIDMSLQTLSVNQDRSPAGR
jgi:hypothetical protein